MSTDATDLRPGSIPFPANASLSRDHRFFAGYALFLLATTLIGFVPDSFQLLDAVRAGARPPLAPILHVHAVLMGTWMLLFVTQSLLPSIGRRALHQQLGIAAFVLLPLLWFVMVAVTRNGWLGFASIPPGTLPQPAFEAIRSLISGVLLEQIKVLVLFPLLVAWALSVRRTDPEMHKRLMLVATLLPLSAAIDRIAGRWLPTDFPSGYDAQYGYLLLWLAPALVHDLWRRGRVHRAYVIAIALNAPFFVATHVLWQSPWWRGMAPRLMGVQID